MIKAIFFFLCTLFFQNTFAQNPKLPGEMDLGMDVFDADIIAENKIKRIHAEYSFKYDLQTIKDDKKEVTYLFNEKGQISKKIEQRHYHNKEDSITFEYYYDKFGQVTTYVKTESKNHTVMLLDKWDSVTAFKVSLYLIPKSMKWNDHVNFEFLIWSDSVYINGLKFQYYNQHGLNYKNMMHAPSSPSKEESLSIYSQDGRLRRKLIYDFAENGELKSIDEKNLNRFLFDWGKTFEYDQGIFIEERFYKEGVQQYIRKITYKDNGLPELDIQRNDITKKMTIIEFEY